MKKIRYVKVTEWNLKAFYDNWGLEGECSGKWEIFALPFVLLTLSIIAIVFYPYYIYKNTKKYRNIFWEKTYNTSNKSGGKNYGKRPRLSK